MRAATPEELLGPLNDVEQRNAPSLLYVDGDVSLLRTGRRVSVVGSRRPSPGGLSIAASLARFLVSHNVTIVSGLAAGVDTAAHRTVLEEGGRTIAVLGTPLDDVSPRSNAALQEAIGTRHLLVSQFPPGSPTKPGNFPQRNRTMALIVDASVIVEAGDSSGTLSQGWEALRLGRPLYVTRLVAENPSLAWPREMASYGAQVVNAWEDLLEWLPSGQERVGQPAF